MEHVGRVAVERAARLNAGLSYCTWKRTRIAKRRSYAELISYLTPPIENAGLYRELAGLKDLVMAYRQSTNETERLRLYESIEAVRQEAHF